MRRYLLEAIICSFIAIYVATFIGCISATVIRKDCWDLANHLMHITPTAYLAVTICALNDREELCRL